MTRNPDYILLGIIGLNNDIRWTVIFLLFVYAFDVKFGVVCQMKFFEKLS